MKPNRQKCKTMGVLLLAGIGYYIETQTLGFTIQCPTHAMVGLKCPACGLTTACIALIQGQLLAAAAANWGLTLSLPVLLPWLGVFIFRWLCDRPPMTKGMKVIGILLLVWFILWAVLRNIWGI